MEVKTQNFEFVFEFQFFFLLRILMKFPACIWQTDLTELFLFSGIQGVKGKHKGHAMIRENRRVNREWTIHIHMQHWAQDTEQRQTKQKHNTEN